MACDEEIGEALKLIEARYKAVPKVCLTLLRAMFQAQASCVLK
jgi:hypothetical protein